MKAEHLVTINDLKHRLAHVESQEANLKSQRDTLYQQHLEVEEKLRGVREERNTLIMAIRMIPRIILPSKQEEFSNHDRH